MGLRLQRTRAQARLDICKHGRQTKEIVFSARRKVALPHTAAGHQGLGKAGPGGQLLRPLKFGAGVKLHMALMKINASCYILKLDFWPWPPVEKWFPSACRSLSACPVWDFSASYWMTSRQLPITLLCCCRLDSACCIKRYASAALARRADHVAARHILRNNHLAHPVRGTIVVWYVAADHVRLDSLLRRSKRFGYMQSHLRFVQLRWWRLLSARRQN